MRRVLSRACPHAELSVVRRLWSWGAYRKLANYLWVEFLLARGSARMWGATPYWLTIDPTNFCQLHCPFCPTGALRGVRDRSSMRLEHFRAFLERVGPSAIHLDLMNWGESLLNRDLPEMIESAKAHGIEVKLDANFNDVSSAMLERLVRSGLDVLSVSIDGLTQETYSRYRVGGDLARVLSNLRELVAARSRSGGKTPRIIWQFLVFRHNEHEVPRVEEFARALGADQVSFVSPYLPNEPGYLAEWSAAEPRFRNYPAPDRPATEEETMRAQGSAHVLSVPTSAAFHARRFRPGQVLRPRAVAAALAMPSTMRDIGKFASRLATGVLAAWKRRSGVGTAPAARRSAEERPICKWPWAGMAVNPDGRVSPCCSVEDQSDDFGSAFARGWGGLWNGRQYRRARRHVRRYVAGRRGVLPDSDHVCERCTAIGRANFRFPLEWTEGKRCE